MKMQKLSFVYLGLRESFIFYFYFLLSLFSDYELHIEDNTFVCLKKKKKKFRKENAESGK